jgi:hypothetical protein
MNVKIFPVSLTVLILSLDLIDFRKWKLLASYKYRENIVQKVKHHLYSQVLFVDSGNLVQLHRACRR